MRDAYPEFQKVGGEVVAVTMGTVQQVARFRERLSLPFPCLSDIERVAYRAYDVPMGTMGQVAGPGIWGAGLKALVRSGGGVPSSNPFQLQSTFVISREGVIRYVHRPRNSADRPSNQELIGVLRSLGSTP